MEKSSGAPRGRIRSGEVVLASTATAPGALYGADSSCHDRPGPSCCRNKGMRTRLGCLSHKSDSCSDFTAILPDKPNRALKWVVWPSGVPVAQRGAPTVWPQNPFFSSELLVGWTKGQYIPASRQLFLYTWMWMTEWLLSFSNVSLSIPFHSFPF